MVIKQILRFIVLLFLQVFVFSHIYLGSYMVPLIYIYFIIKLPFEVPNWVVLFLAFGMGLSVDLFTGTAGLNAAAAVAAAFARPAVIRLLAPRNEFESGQRPAISIMGFQWFVMYALLLTFVNCSVFVFLENFDLTQLLESSLTIVLSTLISVAILVIFDLLIPAKAVRKRI